MNNAKNRIWLALALLAILVLVSPAKASEMTTGQWIFWAVGLVALYFYGTSKDEN